MNRTSTKIIFTICTAFLLFFSAFFITQSVNIAYAEGIQEPVATATGACGTNATWTYYEDTSTLEITGSGSINTYNVGATPWYSYADNIKKIIVSDGITGISKGLFSGMSALEELTIPFVGRDQYISSSSSTSESNKHYPLGYMFGNDSYTGSVAVRQYYTYDYFYSGKYYENGNSNYTEQYYIPATLKTVTVTNAEYIFYGAFSYLYSNSSTGSTKTSPLNITTINLNEGIKRIGSYAFASYNYYGDKGSTSYQYITSNLENVNLPSTLTYISDSVFYNCVKLNNVEIPGTVTAIGDYAFWNCKTATINILRNTTDITVYQHTFTNVPIVKYFDYYSYTNGNNTFYYNVFDGNAVLQKTVTTDTDLTLPTTLGGYTLVKVGNMGVANCTTLTSIVIPANISELSDYAFSGCTGLVTVTIPATCLHVGNYAFNGCTSITTTTIAEGVKYVGDYAFFNCKNLQEIVIPDSCEYLGQGAFYNCSGMKSATIGITVPIVTPFEIKDAKGKTIKGNTYSVRSYDEDGTVYECPIKPARTSDKSFLNMLLR